MKNIFLLGLMCICCCCHRVNDDSNAYPERSSPRLIVLGTIQDAGSPHIGCTKDCCRELFLKPDPSRKVVSLGLIDPWSKKTFIFEATPDFPEQAKMLKNYSSFEHDEMPDGIFLTHAHIGHYAGLMYLGKEGIHAREIPVYAMPGMKSFLEQNGPWSQLVTDRNISIIPLEHNREIQITDNVYVTPFRVPHRDEFSETVGYFIRGPDKRVLFIPDIDKWEKWETDIVEVIASVDFAFLDGTFYHGEELNHRSMDEIPHPFMVESMEFFRDLPLQEKEKIYFIHFNHTNPVLDKRSLPYKELLKSGFRIAACNDYFTL